MRLLRTLSGLTVAALVLTGCGGTNDAPAADPAPQFVAPTATQDPQLSAAADGLRPTNAAGAASAARNTAKATAAPKPTTKKPTTAPATTTPAAKVKYVFPVKASNVDWHTTHSKYKATDIFADCGESVVATTSGKVLEVSLTDSYVKGAPDGPKNGGLSVSLLGDDGVRYYGSHLSKVQSGIKAGVRVSAGQLLGKVGRTGNANNVCHLHYGISAPCAKVGDWKVRRGVVWPYSYLSSWRKGGQKSPVAAVAAWKKSSNCTA